MKNYKKIFFILFFLLFGTWSLPSHALSPLMGSSLGKTETKDFSEGAGFTNYAGANGVTTIINLAIAAFLSMMGIVFIILLVIAGYKYMNAQGDEKAVTESLKSIKHATIGLVIVISAYAITYFVFSNLPGGRMTIQDSNSSSVTGL